MENARALHWSLRSFSICWPGGGSVPEETEQSQTPKEENREVCLWAGISRRGSRHKGRNCWGREELKPSIGFNDVVVGEWGLRNPYWVARRGRCEEMETTIWRTLCRETSPLWKQVKVGVLFHSERLKKDVSWPQRLGVGVLPWCKLGVSKIVWQKMWLWERDGESTLLVHKGYHGVNVCSVPKWDILQ